MGVVNFSLPLLIITFDVEREPFFLGNHFLKDPCKVFHSEEIDFVFNGHNGLI